MKKLKRLGRRMFALILATVLCLGGAPELTVQAAQTSGTRITDSALAWCSSDKSDDTKLWNWYNQTTFYTYSPSNPAGLSWNFPTGKLPANLPAADSPVYDEGPVWLWALGDWDLVNNRGGAPFAARNFRNIKVNGQSATNGGTVNLGYANVTVSWETTGSTPKLKFQFFAGDRAPVSGDKIEIDVDFDFYPLNNGGSVKGNTGFIYGFNGAGSGNVDKTASPVTRAVEIDLNTQTAKWYSDRFRTLIGTKSLVDGKTSLETVFSQQMLYGGRYYKFYPWEIKEVSVGSYDMSIVSVEADACEWDDTFDDHNKLISRPNTAKGMRSTVTAQKPGETSVKIGTICDISDYVSGGTLYSVDMLFNTTLYIRVIGDKPTYTVTYTDGVPDEVVFENQSYAELAEGAATPAFKEEAGKTEVITTTDGKKVVQPIRKGYIFLGWEPDVAETVTRTVTYVAKWQEMAITGFEKELVNEQSKVPQGIDTTGIIFPGSGSVKIPTDGSATLLYKITVTGTPGKNYVVTDTGAQWVGGSVMTGTIPETGTANIYVKRSFTSGDINDDGYVVNTAKVTPGKGTESSTTSTETTRADEAEPAPDRPTPQEVNRLVRGNAEAAVLIYCEPGRHKVGKFDCYNTSDPFSEENPGHTDRIRIGNVIETDGVYTCEVTFLAEKYKAAYSSLKKTEHNLLSNESDKSVNFQWDASGKKWKLAAGSKTPVTFRVACEEPATTAPNLEISKTVDKSTADVGDILTYTITVQNTGNAKATEVTVTDRLPQNVAYESGLGNVGFSYDEDIHTVTAAKFELEPDGTKILTLKVKAGSAGKAENTAIAACKETTEPETSQPAETDINYKITVGKEMGETQVDEENGTAVVPYTVTVTNTSGADLYGLDIIDALTTTVKSGTADMRLVPDSLTVDGTAVAGFEAMPGSVKPGKESRTWKVIDRSAAFSQGSQAVLKYRLEIVNTGEEELQVDLENTATGGTWKTPGAPAKARIHAAAAANGGDYDITDSASASGNIGTASGSVTIPTAYRTITYNDGVDDAEIFADQVYKAKKGDATPQFNGTPVRPGYIFVGWEPAVAEKVTTDATYKAKWAPEARTITATWKNGETNETIQGPREYPEGTAIDEIRKADPEAPAAPEGKEFDKWVVETDDGGNVTITATYKDREPQKPETITVTWKNGETGETIKELNDKYPKGTPADGVSADDYPGAPEMPGKEFREWTLETDADGNIIITAIYRVKENPDPIIPDPGTPAPTMDDIRSLIAVMVTDAGATDHGAVTYSVEHSSVTIGNVSDNGDGTYTCDVTISPEWYVSSYNAGHGLHTHANQPETVTLVYSAPTDGEAEETAAEGQEADGAEETAPTAESSEETADDTASPDGPSETEPETESESNETEAGTNEDEDVDKTAEDTADDDREAADSQETDAAKEAVGTDVAEPDAEPEEEASGDGGEEPEREEPEAEEPDKEGTDGAAAQTSDAEEESAEEAASADGEASDDDGEAMEEAAEADGEPSDVKQDETVAALDTDGEASDTETAVSGAQSQDAEESGIVELAEEADGGKWTLADAADSVVTFIVNCAATEEPGPTEPESPTDPTEPSEPGNPTDPTEPSEPENPTDPAEPSEPENPTDPAEPSEPENPTDPAEPSEPENPTDPTEPNEPGNPIGPTEPNEPTNPTDPTNPTIPGNPIRPTEPAGPSNPTAPTNPTTPAQPGDTPTAIDPTPAVPVAPTPAVSVAAAPAITPVAPTVPVEQAPEDEPEEEEIGDDDAPLAAPEEAEGTDAPEGEESTVIEDDDTPLAAMGEGTGRSWALLNLILTLLTALISLLMLTFYFYGKRRQGEDEERQYMHSAQDGEEEELKRKGLVRLLSILPAVLALITFILTEDMRNPMIFVDKWTLLMLLYAVVNAALAILSIKKREEMEEEHSVNR